MTDMDVYLAYSEQYRLIDDNLDDLVRRAESFLQATLIIDGWKQANKNYIDARNKVFDANQELIKTLFAEFTASTKSIQEALNELKKTPDLIGKVASLISSAVKKGTELKAA